MRIIMKEDGGMEGGWRARLALKITRWFTRFTRLQSPCNGNPIHDWLSVMGYMVPCSMFPYIKSGNLVEGGWQEMAGGGMVGWRR